MSENKDNLDNVIDLGAYKFLRGGYHTSTGSEHPGNNEPYDYEQDKQPNYRLRRAAALTAVALTGFLGARTAGSDEAKWVTDTPIEAAKAVLTQAKDSATDPKGRKIPEHNVRYENVGQKGGVYFGTQGNAPRQQK